MDDLARYLRTNQIKMRRAAWLLTGDWTSADDLVQSSLERMIRHKRTLGSTEIGPYFQRVLINTYLTNSARHWRGEVPTETLPELAQVDSSSQVDSKIDLAHLLELLPPRQRACIVLRYFEDLTEAATAVALGTTIGTVKSQTHWALEKLRTSLALTSTLAWEEKK